VKLNKSAIETFASLTEAYGDATLSRTMVFKWHKAFKEGRKIVENDPRSGRPNSSTNDQNVEVVPAVMAKDRRLSVRIIAQETFSHAFYKDILERLRLPGFIGTLQTIGCCTTITRQLTLRCQFENLWPRKIFRYFHILPTAQI